MKTKKTVNTMVLVGRVEIATVAHLIFDETGIRLILDEVGQEVNGSINGYYQNVEGKDYTLIDIFYYDEDGDILESKKERTKDHKIKRIFLTKKKTKNIINIVKSKFEFATEEISLLIIKKLGNN